MSFLLRNNQKTKFSSTKNKANNKEYYRTKQNKTKQKTNFFGLMKKQ